MPAGSDRERRDTRDLHRRATIVDVAAMAGVSRQTVSRVLGRAGPVAEETRARVTSAIRELGYRPNQVARTLVQRRSCILGVSARDLNSPLTAPFIARLQALSRASDYHVIVSNFDLDDEGGVGTLHTFVSLNVDGIALFPSVMKADVIEQFARFYAGRVVAVGRTAPLEGVCALSLDEIGAARLVVDHLRSRGRGRIAILADEWYPDTVHPRIAGLEASLRDASCSPVRVVGGHKPTIEGGASAMVDLVSAVSAGDIDAVVCYNDTMAIGALHACRGLRLSVPGDVALVGYDNIPYGAVTSPPLTTVPQDAERYAEITFELLAADEQGDTPPFEGVTLVTSRLEIRGST